MESYILTCVSEIHDPFVSTTNIPRTGHMFSWGLGDVLSLGSDYGGILTSTRKAYGKGNGETNCTVEISSHLFPYRKDSSYPEARSCGKHRVQGLPDAFGGLQETHP